MTRIGEFRGVPWLGFVVVATVVLALTVGLARGASAATRFVVTLGNDSGNTCLTSGAPCKTITHALTQAVANDTISVAAGTYNLALGETFPLSISTLTLTGAGAGSTIIDATGANTSVITINSGVTATISGVTITGGAASCINSGSGECGAVGGGLSNFGTLTLTNSTVSGNTASCTNSGSGACLAGGGGLVNHGTLTVTNSTVSGNTASCTNSGSDECDAEGGGLHNAAGGTLTVTNSTVNGNATSCTNSASGRCFATGGGLDNIVNDSTLTVTNSTVSGNTASCTNSGSVRKCFAEGGGLNNSDGTLTLTNSTVSGNTASCTTSGSSECSAGGAGLWNGFGGTLTVTNATVTKNSVTCSGAGCTAAGGGLNNSDGTATLRNTIVAKHLAGADCANISGTLTSNGFNLDSDNTCHLAQPSDKPNVTNPLLGPLANNGGPTQTHALLPGSPAIDAGTNTGCPSTDQRGVARPQGAACDIGAFELVSTSSPGPTGPANARQLLNVGTFIGPTAPPTPQQQQQTFLATDPLLAGATYYDPAEACVGVPPAGIKFFVFTPEGQLVLGRNRDTGGVSSTQIGTSKYQALLATLDPGALPPGAYTLVFWVKDCTDTAVLVSEFYAIQVLSP